MSPAASESKNKTCKLHRPIANLSCFQNSAYYAGITIFNSLPSNLTTLMDKQAQFKVALKKYLIFNLFFQITQNVCNVFLSS
jgi:hypothetical protein